MTPSQAEADDTTQRQKRKKKKAAKKADNAKAADAPPAPCAPGRANPRFIVTSLSAQKQALRAIQWVDFEGRSRKMLVRQMFA
jgi:hypothetical protein